MSSIADEKLKSATRKSMAFSGWTHTNSSRRTEWSCVVRPKPNVKWLRPDLAASQTWAVIVHDRHGRIVEVNDRVECATARNEQIDLPSLEELAELRAAVRSGVREGMRPLEESAKALDAVMRRAIEVSAKLAARRR